MLPSVKESVPLCPRHKEQYLHLVSCGRRLRMAFFPGFFAFTLFILPSLFHLPPALLSLPGIKAAPILSQISPTASHLRALFQTDSPPASCRVAPTALPETLLAPACPSEWTSISSSLWGLPVSVADGVSAPEALSFRLPARALCFGDHRVAGLCVVQTGKATPSTSARISPSLSDRWTLAHIHTPASLALLE